MMHSRETVQKRILWLFDSTKKKLAQWKLYNSEYLAQLQIFNQICFFSTVSGGDRKNQ